MCSTISTNLSTAYDYGMRWPYWGPLERKKGNYWSYTSKKFS